ncbi:MAG TPA: nucleotide sugar dehydrogenase [Actinomycetota bacterium]|nr:nucleotide sugar dehydrogenase [Actinomycetota bacterium]
MSTKVAVVGLGKIGLPLSVQFALNGCDVIGCDVSEARVAEVTTATNPFPDEAHLDERLRAAVKRGQLRATTDTTAAVRDADVAILIVPLYAGPDHTPDVSIMESAADAVADGLHDGMLIVVETTMPVGATRRLAQRMEQRSGQTPGSGFFMAFSPERVYSGRIFADLLAYPKLVGGLDAESGKRAAAFYRSVLPHVEVRELANAETAEMAKLAETIYRDVNIALANELARYADGRGVDIGQVIAASNSQPFSHIHEPGVGVGGHCIPHYPWFVIADDPEATLMPAARAINDGQPGWVLDRVASEIGGLEGKRVLVLGLSYRAGVKEPTSSPGIDLVRLLPERGAAAYGHDPLFDDDEIAAFGATPATPEDLGEFDAVIVQAAHPEYGRIDWSGCKPGCAVVDGRNTIDRASVEAGGARYLGIGR